MSVPLVVIGEPCTVVLKITPSPVIPTLVTAPDSFATNIVRTSVIELIAVASVVTCAMGMLVELKPVVLDVGAQLFAASRYT
jgi:hypothetical protein